MSTDSVNPGKYLIQFYPPGPHIGSRYASMDEPNKPVKLVNIGPQNVGPQDIGKPDFRKQEWLVAYGDNQDRQRIFSTFNGSLLSTTDKPTVVPSGPVIAFVPGPFPHDSGVGPVIQEQNWIITPVKTDKAINIYTIQAPTGAVGIEFYIGVEGDEMFIQVFGFDDVRPRPQWQFIQYDESKASK